MASSGGPTRVLRRRRAWRRFGGLWSPGLVGRRRLVGPLLWLGLLWLGLLWLGLLWLGRRLDGRLLDGRLLWHRLVGCTCDPLVGGGWRVRSRCRRRRPRLRQRHRRARAGGGRPCRSGGTPQRVALDDATTGFSCATGGSETGSLAGALAGSAAASSTALRFVCVVAASVASASCARSSSSRSTAGAGVAPRGDRRLGHDVVEDAPVGGAEEEHRGGPLRRILGDEGLAGAGGGLVDGEPVGERAVELGGEASWRRRR